MSDLTIGSLKGISQKSGDKLGVLSELGFELVKTELVAVVELDQELICLDIFDFQPEAVHAQEHGGDGNSCSFVPIDERVVLGKALEQGGRLLDDVPIVSALGSCQSRFERAPVADALGAAEKIDQPRVGGENVIKGGVKRHWASRRSNSG